MPTQLPVRTFGLAALGSLSLSMTDNLSLSMTLRLRGNANACNRCAEQNRRALQQSRLGTKTSDHIPPAPATAPDHGLDEAELMASVAAVRKQAAETNASLQAAQPAAEPAPIKARRQRARRRRSGIARRYGPARWLTSPRNSPPTSATSRLSSAGR
jgi:hypothetical protein